MWSWECFRPQPYIRFIFSYHRKRPGQRFKGHSCSVTDPAGFIFPCGQRGQTTHLMIFTQTPRTYHHSTHPILYGLSGCLNNNELTYVETGINDWVIQSGIRRKDGLQRWHSMKTNALLYTQTPRLHLGQLPSSSIINDRRGTGINWYPIHSFSCRRERGQTTVRLQDLNSTWS